MPFNPLIAAVATVPAGKWAVGVSGGADSVALVRLLVDRRDLSLHVVHLDHELRGDESASDAAFVEDLARCLGVPCAIARRSEVESAIHNLPSNLESRGRAMRFSLFEKVVRERALAGVILAHHADDEAETILMRLTRGSLWWTLRGIEPAAQHGELLVLRPLLEMRRVQLREYLRSIGQSWREDSSNVTVQFARNRARQILNGNPTLIAPCIDLARRCDTLCDWIDGVAPTLSPFFAVGELADRPVVIARLSAMRWLLSQGCPPTECSTEVIDRLIEMCRDAAAPARRHFPGSIEVRRRGGIISAKVP